MAHLFVDRLTVIDFSYLHPERGLLGESWLLDIELEGALDDQGMVLDFSQVKKRVKQAVDEGFDHKLLVPTLYSGSHISHQGERCNTRFRLQSGQEIQHSAPADATSFIPAECITFQTVADAIKGALAPCLPNNITDIQIKLRTEQRSGRFYLVSHGLKHHAGNCQRIAHGHRSYIEIFRNGAQDTELEQEWARRWQDIYIGTREDLAAELTRDSAAYYRFVYQAAQGRFELELPKERCYLIDTDSTVENLADHIAFILKQEHSDSSFRVRAFEGINKGAIAEAP